MKLTHYQLKSTGKLSSREFADVWGVQSESNPEKTYTVALNKKGVWSCGCPRWTRNASRPECKHIKKIKEFRDQGFKGQYAEEIITDQAEKQVSRFSQAEV